MFLPSKPTTVKKVVATMVIVTALTLQNVIGANITAEGTGNLPWNLAGDYIRVSVVPFENSPHDPKC